MDKYDYMEIAYRTGLFIAIVAASSYVLSRFVDLAKQSTGWYPWFLAILYIFVWIVFVIGIAAYLIFVAKGSFRPKPPEDENDDDEDNVPEQNPEELLPEDLK